MKAGFGVRGFHPENPTSCQLSSVGGFLGWKGFGIKTSISFQNLVLANLIIGIVKSFENPLMPNCTVGAYCCTPLRKPTKNAVDGFSKTFDRRNLTFVALRRVV